MARERNPLVVSGVVGDILDPFAAVTDLRLFTDGGRMVFSGASFRPSQVAAAPRVEIGGEDFRTFYTLVMVDADSPTPADPYFRAYLHWLVTDIPGSTGASYGNEIVSYEGPQPSMGIHRLVFVLFRQNGRITVRSPRWRQGFSVREFSQLHNLGNPVAAIYYNCHREAGTGGRRL
ncbi:protein HEADING DATE 3A-like [Andrographis paniculata]|uniref:protein HEADING DATE 3A-like n=1 Tax=Andrographis paniculata TaxID=175694 RepID=UPI0021E6DCF3|nr:protein HEADING DATE 3A-like [Andrographis paniculata]XP_051129023.1 protein HEADING DATE 3A-like [Andrographis paniculata]